MKKVINELAVATATVVTSIAIAVAAHYVVAILDLFVQQHVYNKKSVIACT